MNEAVLSFRCIQDEDVEKFLHEKAFDYSDHGWCSVYLLFNALSFYSGKLEIEAYFTLSHKSMVADRQSMSRSAITRYGGISSAKTLDFVLIGQLGKYIDENRRSSISGKEILDRAFEVIRQAAELIPCKYALIECSDNENVRRFYEDNNFIFFQKDKLNLYTRKI